MVFNIIDIESNSVAPIFFFSKCLLLSAAVYTVALIRSSGRIAPSASATVTFVNAIVLTLCFVLLLPVLFSSAQGRSTGVGIVEMDG